MKKGTIFLLVTAIWVTAKPTIRVVFLPFEDRVKLKEAWNLAVDIPRWYSQTLDTIDEPDSAVIAVCFDSVLNLLSRNDWKPQEYRESAVMKRIGLYFDAKYIISGVVNTFQITKRSVGTDTKIEISHTFLEQARGKGGTTVVGGLQNYSAKIVMSVSIYRCSDGSKVTDLQLDSDERDGGIALWMPFQIENEEINFHYMSRTPFGSTYFQRSIAGALMRNFSLMLRRKILQLAGNSKELMAGNQETFIEGKILERAGEDVYLNLGNHERLFIGEKMEVMKPDRPLVDSQGDTLGWVEKNVGTIAIRAIKSDHFSVGYIIEEKDTIMAGCTVRSIRK